MVTRNGRPLAMIISIANEDDLDGLLPVHNVRFLGLFEEWRERVRVAGGVPLAEFRRRHALDSKSRLIAQVHWKWTAIVVGFNRL